MIETPSVPGPQRPIRRAPGIAAGLAPGRPPVDVAIVITGLQTGGAETMLLKLLPRLLPDVRPHVISLTGDGDLGAAMREAGVPVESLGASIASAPIALARLSGRLRALRPDIVQTFLYHGDLVGGLAARLARVPAVVWNVRNSGMQWGEMKPTTRVAIRACAMLSGVVPDRIVCCSRAATLRHAAAGYRADRFVHIANGVDLGRFSPDPAARRTLRAALDIGQEAEVVGHFARLDPQKDHATMLRAFRMLRERRPRARLLLVGRGLEADGGFARAYRDAGYADADLRFLGRREDVPALMAACDVVASSSLAEAFPNVVAESMACGVPCVVTDVGDSAEIVGTSGHVVPPSDPAALATACEALLGLSAEARRALGDAARRRVADRFEIDAVAARYRRFYMALASGATHFEPETT
jgi:glycosyltransferase involved in cell wall biosynthesis